MKKLFLMIVIITFQSLCWAEADSVIQSKIPELQEHLTAWRRSHKVFLVEGVHPKKLNIVTDLQPDELPRVSFIAQKGELLFHIPPTRAEGSISQVYLVVLIANMFSEFISASNQEDLLIFLKRLASPIGPSIFKLSEYQMSSSNEAVVNERLLVEQLILLSRIKELEPRLRQMFDQLFPETRLDWIKIQQEVIPKILQDQYAVLMQRNWSRLQRFYQSAGSPRLKNMIEKNDRAGVADYLLERLPNENLTGFQRSFFLEQIEAIRNPSASLTSTVFRGGSFQIEGDQGPAYVSINIANPSRAGDAISEPYMLNLLMHETSVLETIMRHAKSTSRLFISTTVYPEIAEKFSERSGVLSVIQIDRRRLIPSFFDQRMGEGEYLVPFIIFPDEIIADSRNTSIRTVLSRYKKRVEKSEQELQQTTFKVFTEKHKLISCQIVI